MSNFRPSTQSHSDKPKISTKKIDPTKEKDTAHCYNATIEQIQLLLDHMTDEQRILVLGAKKVGKTAFINSIYFALTDKPKELLQSNHMAKNEIRKAEVFKRKVDIRTVKVTNAQNPGTAIARKVLHKKALNIDFYDSHGLEDVHDQDKLATILTYLLEGKLKDKEYHWTLMQNEKTLNKCYKNIEADQSAAFKAIILLEDYKENDGEAITLADTLNKAIRKSDKMSVKNIPIIRIMLDSDKSNDKHVTNNNRLILTDFKQGQEIDRLSNKHNFGLPPMRFNLTTYKWSDMVSAYDMDCGDDPSGYIKLQEEMLEQFNKQREKERNLEELKQQCSSPVSKQRHSSDTTQNQITNSRRRASHGTLRSTINRLKTEQTASQSCTEENSTQTDIEKSLPRITKKQRPKNSLINLNRSSYESDFTTSGMESCVNSSSDTENEGNGVFTYNSRPKKSSNHLGTLIEESSNVKLDKEATEKETPLGDLENFSDRLPEKIPDTPVQVPTSPTVSSLNGPKISKKSSKNLISETTDSCFVENSHEIIISAGSGTSSSGVHSGNFNDSRETKPEQEPVKEDNEDQSSIQKPTVGLTEDEGHITDNLTEIEEELLKKVTMRDNQKESETKMTTLQIPENHENKDDSKGNLSQKSNSCSNLHDLKNDEQDPGGSPPLTSNFNDQQNTENIDENENEPKTTDQNQNPTEINSFSTSKSRSISCASGINFFPSERFEYNVRICPSDNEKQRLSHLLIFEYILEVIYKGEQGPGILWKLDRSVNANTGPLSNLFNNLMGIPHRNRRSNNNNNEDSSNNSNNNRSRGLNPANTLTSGLMGMRSSNSRAIRRQRH